MKYKKRSLKKKQRRHHFSKKYANVQRGGGFMDAIADLNAMEGMEGRINTCMAVHPTQQLVAVGDDAGTVTLWEINQPQPKRVAQLMGLQTTVKCVEFHPTIPVVAAACSDIVLMWRIDQIDREQQDQQVQPSHTVSDFRLRNVDVVGKEYDEAERILEEERRNKKRVEKELETLLSRNWQVKKEIEEVEPNIEDYERYMYNHNRRGETDKVNEYRDKLKDLKPRLLKLQEEIKLIEEQRKTLDKRQKEFDIWGKEKIVKEKDAELQKIEKGARDEVSCFSFHTQKSYIAVGVNNDILKNVNRVNMYEFKIEPPSSVQLLYSLYLSSERFIPSEKVLFTSFSSDGQMLSFVTLKQNGTTVLQLINFKGANNTYAIIEIGSYELKKKCSCIAPYRTSVGYHDGRYYKFAGTMRTHGFIIGCDDGSLMLIDAVTIYVSDIRLTRVEAVRQSKEWNTGEAIECVAVHPNLHLVASGSRSAAKLWDIDQREPLESLALQDVKSVGFNQQFLAVCSPDGLGIYSCNSDDYSGFKEKFQKELQEKIKRKELLGQLHTELRDKTLKGKCAICFESMTGPIQPAITSGPEEVVETYLPCGHKFHKKCIEEWFKQGKTCPECRAKNGLPQSTPANVVDKRTKKLGELEQQLNAEDRRALLARRALFAPASPASPAPASPAPQAEYYSSEQQQPPKSDGGKRKNKNKYSRRKNRSKKSKIRRRYSIKK